MQEHFNKLTKWIKPPPELKLQKPFIKARPLKPLDNNRILYEIQTYHGRKQIPILISDSFQMSTQQKTFEDMCHMNVLNQPEVLNNLVQRYQKEQIFTYIGPTLIVLNPYRILPQYFDKKVMLKIRENIINENLQNDEPHVYMIAGKAYLHMKKSQTKQAIVISGESGAGKTQSTKYCMQILTSLSHIQSHQIQTKILSCNPLLQAFGNSKTVRNDNSSRFGKYVQIYFGNDNTIKGANIHSYLLEKSRVVSIAKGQRSFHAFYALTASKKYNVKPVNQYQFLKESECYTTNHMDDRQYFKQINKAMSQIGFKQEEQNKIWLLLKAILQLGNIQFDDKKHQQNQDIPCQIINKQLLKSISEVIQLQEQRIEKLLLFERKNMVNNIIFKPYKKDGCIGHRNTFCKAIYNTIFEFILHKIQISLNPKQMNHYKSINILDIFGFQNFQKNSFEQLCINFTNQKLLKLYNEYIFKREMQILKQDGLEQDIKAIKPPTNDQIISIINGPDLKSISIFSIINDNTSQQQFTDQNIKDSIENKFKNSPLIGIKKAKDLLFTIKHSQCQVEYNVNGFKLKNMDKVNDDILEVINNFKYINTGKKPKEQKGKTLLKKFVTQIDTLIKELSSSNVHFIRCIKPNEIKKPNFPDSRYILSQVRYLGVFQTIQIRKKTFPVRKEYQEFINEYKMLFPHIDNKKAVNNRKLVEYIVKDLKCQNNQFMLGNRRVYINQRIEAELNKKVYEFFKKRNQQVKKIQQVCKRFVFTSIVSRKVKLLVQRKQIWRKLGEKYKKNLLNVGFKKMFEVFQKQKEKIRQKEVQERKKKEQQINKKKSSQFNINTKNTSTGITKENKISEQKIARTLNKNQQEINQKFFKYSKVIIKAHTKMTLAQPFNKLKSAILKNGFVSIQKDLNETILVQQPDSNPSIFKLKKKVDQPTQNKINQQHKFSESFYDEQSVYISPGADVIFSGNLKIPMFQKTKQTLEKLNLLKAILGEKYKSLYSNNQSEVCSPQSEDSNFRIEDCPQDIMNKVINFPIDDFFHHVLRKRTGVFGMKKDYSEILTFKPKPLSKTLTQLSSQQQSQAIKVFKLLIKIGEQTVLDNVFKLVDNVMRYCQQTTQSLKNEIFLQLIKQSNNQYQVPAIRLYQTFSVYLHIYTPDQDFLYAALHLFFNKIAEKKHHQKQQQFLRYLFKKIIRKIQRPYGVGYMPIKYQIMALMSKRQISIPIYLPIGNNILVKAQSYQTFGDIKNKVLQQLGINIHRIPAQFFTFFEVVNYQNTQLEQSPVNQNSVIWDVMTYWELAKEKYQQSGVPAPYFSIMVKIKFPYECTYDDEETIEIYFAQCYFDYSMGRIRLQLRQMAMLAACIKKIKLTNQPNQDVQGCFPLWMTKVYDKQTFKKYIFDNILWLQQNHLDQLAIKYKFLEICSECPLALTFAVPTEHTIKLFLKPKRIYLVQKGIIVAEFSIRQIAKWSNNHESFNFQIKKKDGTVQNKTHMIMTEYSHMCTDYLNKVSEYLLKYGGRNKKASGNNILKEI